MGNPISYRVCGNCSLEHDDHPITNMFTDTYFKCKLCGKEFTSGCYMLFAHDAKEHYIEKPVMFIGDRQSGKTTWLLNKINEYESVTGPRFYVIVGHGTKAAASITRELGFKLGFIKNEHYKIFIPQRTGIEQLDCINSESNVYVDEVQMLDMHSIAELSSRVASGRIRQLFTTRQQTALDLLTDHSHIYKGKFSKEKVDNESEE